MSRVVRQSKYRHVFGTPHKREQCYDNLKINKTSWDTNFVSSNKKYFAVNWDSQGGGALAVINWEHQGKLANNYPLILGHKGTVLDLDFHPFNDDLIVSASEDGTAKVWSIPEGGVKENLIEPAQTLKGHKRKVGTCKFNPVANNVIATSSTDFAVKIWDIETGKDKASIEGQHTDIVQSLEWNWAGSLILTACKDKKIRLIDPRAGSVVQEAAGHPGVKGSRACFLGDKDKIFNVGFSKQSERQFTILDPKNIAESIVNQSIDTGSGILMPFYDNDTSLLFLAGKGDGNIRYYELSPAADQIYYISEYKTNVPTRGMAILPKYVCDVSQCEVVRLLKLSGSMLEPIAFAVPRKSDMFQDDIFPDTRGFLPGCSAEEWFGGSNAQPATISLAPGFKAPERPKESFNPTVVKEEEGPKSEAEFREEFEKLKNRVAYLEAEIVKRDARIRELESKGN